VAATVTIEWKPIYADLAQRNGSVEATLVHRHRDGEGTPPTYKVRLLQFEDDMVIIERPQRTGDEGLGKGDHIRLLATDGSQRVECETQVLRGGNFKLNAQQSVPALQLAPPAYGQSAQRRNFYRASLAAAKLQASAQPVDDAGEATPDTEPISTRVINLSGGGIGLEAPQSAAQRVEAASRYRVILPIPLDDEPIAVVVRQVHLQFREDGTSYLGLAFDWAGVEPTDQRRRTDAIVAFATEVQRDQIRRQREKNQD